MSIRYLVFVGICLCVARYVYAVDLTLVDGETSRDAIDETVRKIRTKCYLAEDYNFLRRLAGAQMRSITATTGGIWRVTSIQLTTVQNACKGRLKAKCSQIKTDFNIDISTLTMSGLQKPLYSGLVMSLFIINLRPPIPVDKYLQSNLWINRINGKGNSTHFFNVAAELENITDCTSAQIDLVFVIDSSSSVGKINFNKTLIFLTNVVSKLDISPAETRVAVVKFSTLPVIEFDLGNYSTEAAVKNAINKIDYNGGGTATDLALDKAHSDVFNTSTRDSVAAKVLVLVTDGKSNNETRTIAAAKRLKDDGVVIFTIGVVNPRKSELIAAASEPSCTHFINLKDYNEIGFIVKEIRSESCKAKIFVTNETDLTNNTITNGNETKVQVVDLTTVIHINDNTVIEVSVHCGVVTVYGAYNNSYPNEASYDYMFTAADNKLGRLYVVKRSYLSNFVITVVSQRRFDIICNAPSYNISINKIDPGLSVTCRQSNQEILCPAKDLSNIFNKIITNPCTAQNILKKLYIFPYPNSQEKYFQCDGVNKLVIVFCPTNQHFNATQKRCNGTMPGIPMSMNPCRLGIKQFYFPYPKDMRKYIQCSEWGQIYIRDCPPPFLYWNPVVYTCTRAPRVSVCSPKIAKIIGKPVFSPYPFSTSYFIQCGVGSDYNIRQCPSGTQWDQFNSMCH